jgi:hypothetical protein
VNTVGAFDPDVVVVVVGVEEISDAVELTPYLFRNKIVGSERAEIIAIDTTVNQHVTCPTLSPYKGRGSHRTLWYDKFDNNSLIVLCQDFLPSNKRTFFWNDLEVGQVRTL